MILEEEKISGWYIQTDGRQQANSSNVLKSIIYFVVAYHAIRNSCRLNFNLLDSFLVYFRSHKKWIKIIIV